MTPVWETLIESLVAPEVIGSVPDQLDSVTHDSRQVKSGSLYCCVVGANADGHDFAGDAVKAGATALLVQKKLDLDVTQIIVGDVRQQMGAASAAVFGDPSSELSLLGVTGTNGKSSVIQLLADIWDVTDNNSEIYGTLTQKRTTEEAPLLQAALPVSYTHLTLPTICSV